MRKQLLIGTIQLLAALTITSNSLAMDVFIRKDNPEVGNFITDENEKTLYTFQKDPAGKSVCGAANDCIKKWPVFYADFIEAEGPIKNSDFGTIVRDDGRKQTTYQGKPLYYFSKDVKPGDIFGNGVNNIWSVARP